MTQLKELANKHFDIIISNPPYGRVGAEITDYIRKNFTWGEFVNLLPANDYKKVKDLYKYVDVNSLKKTSFDNVPVTTMIAKILKQPNYFLSQDQFEIETYKDNLLKKYFYSNLDRKHYAIDKSKTILTFSDNLTNATTIILDHRCLSHCHLAYSRNTYEYLWNVNKTIDNNDLKKSYATSARCNKYTITFASEAEATNMSHFIYSKDGFRFISKLFTSVAADSTTSLGKVLPKVDWSRSWTVEEILREYNYTDDEIKEVIDDLNNFKYLND